MYNTPTRSSSGSNMHSGKSFESKQISTPLSIKRNYEPKHLSLSLQKSPQQDGRQPLIYSANSLPAISSQIEKKSRFNFVENADKLSNKKVRLVSQVKQKPNIQDYHRVYKIYPKLEDLPVQSEETLNLYISMLQEAEKNNLMPKMLALLDNNSTEIDAKGILTNPAYFYMFMKGLNTNFYKDLKSLDLSCNIMQPDQIQKITLSLPQHLKKLNLSQNKLAKTHIFQLNTLLTKSYITNLNLSRNMLGDSGVEILVKGLWNNQMLEVLNLTNNYIGDLGAQYLGDYIRSEQNLQELYLQYNQIGVDGGTQFFKGLYKNQNLKVLDFSYNKLGGLIDCTLEICKVIAKPHPELLHFDLSKNSFTNEETQMISTDLAFNQKIYGFHYEENLDYKVNSRGWLVKNNFATPKSQSISSFKDLDQLDDQNSEETKKITQSLEHLEIKRNNGHVRQQIMQIDSTNIQDNVKFGDVCWICQGWVEIEFVYSPKISGSIDSFPLFLHLEFEDYRPSLMEFDNNKFTLTRMCPPNQTIRYFFSNPVQCILSYARDQGTIHTAQYSQLRNNGIPIKYSDGTVLMSHQMLTVNYLHSNPPRVVIDSVRHYIPLIMTKPRQPEKIVPIDPDLYKKQLWSLEKSFFKNFISDSNQRLEECLSKDMEFMKCTTTMKDYEPLKKEILPYYASIVQYYKFMVSQNDTNYQSFPKIDEFGIRYIYDQIKKVVKQTEWTLILLTTQTIKQMDWKYFHELSIVRHQFTEIIFRVARNLNISFSQCIKQVFPFILDIESAQDWRDKRYWTQIMDVIIQLKLPLLKALFQLTHLFTYKKSIRPEKFISLQDFKNLFFFSNLLEKYVSEQDIQLIFLQSMQLQPDELNSAEHFEMTFIEFVEALARMADKISPRSPSFKVQDLNQQQRTILPLYVKFEGLLFILFHRLKSRLTFMGFGNLEKTCVNNPKATNKLLKLQGIHMENQASSSDDESDTESVLKQPKKQINPEQLIQNLLNDEVTSQLSQTSTSTKSFRIKPQKPIIDGQVKISQGWKKIRGVLRSKTMIPSNIMQSIKEAQHQQAIMEQYHEENSSPYTKGQFKKIDQAIKEADFQLKIIPIKQQYEFVQDAI